MHTKQDINFQSRFFSHFEANSRWILKKSLFIRALLILNISLFSLSQVNAQCELVLNNVNLGVFGPPQGVASLYGQDTISVGGFSDYIGCTGSDIYFDGSGFHDFWLEEGSSMVLEGASGFFNVFAMNNNTITIESGSGGGDFFIGSGSSIIVHSGSGNYSYYIECGGTLIIESPSLFFGQIYAECPSTDIIDINGSLVNTATYNIIECTEVSSGLSAAQIPGTIVDLGGAVVIDCADFPYTLDASSVPGPYTWSTGETTATIQVNSPGSYTCSVPSNCGTAAGTAIVQTPNGDNLDLGEDADYCASTYPITLDAGVFDSYLWSDGSTGQTLEVTGPGTYSVAVSNSCGSYSDVVVINAFPDLPSLVWDYDPSDCGTVYPFVLDAGPFDSYLWGTGETSQTYAATGPGTYTVDVTNSCGSATYTITLETQFTPPTVDWGPDLDLCSANFPFTLDAGDWDSYLWDSGEVSQTLLVTGPGAYGVTVTNSCGTAYDDISIILLGQTPSIDFGPDIDFCDGQFPILIDATTNYDTYIWTTGETTTSILASGPGTYGVTVSNVCGSDYDEVVIGSAGSIPQPDLGMDRSVCVEYAPYTLDAGPGNTYLWSTGENTQTISINASGTYSVQVSNDCGTGTDEVVLVAYDDRPDIQIGNYDICADEFPYTLSGNVIADSYSWSSGETTPTITVDAPGGWFTLTAVNECGLDAEAGSVTSLPPAPAPDLGVDQTVCPSNLPLTLDAGLADSYVWSTGETTQTITVNSAGSYSVDATSACGTGSDEIIINVDAAGPQPNLGADLSLCPADLPFTLDAGIADTYLWSTGETSQSIAINSAGTYTVNASSACGAGADDITITMEANPLPVNLGPDVTLCPADFPLSLDAGMADSYLWSSGETSQTIAINTAGTYTVTATSACGIESDDIVISVGSAGPIPDLGTDLTVCPADLPITLDAGAATSYLWSTGETSQTILINAAGNYSVSASNSCGTGTDDMTLTVIANPLPVNLGPDVTLCPADFPLSLDAGMADSYLWSSGETSQTIAINTAGTYTVTATSACGIESDDIVISVGSAGPMPDLGTDLTVCPADLPITLDAGAATSYLWSTGETSQTILINAAGNYSVSASNSCGTGTDDMTLTVIANPLPVNLGPDVTLCPADFPLSLDAGMADSYLWSSGETSQTITINTAGTYSVTATSACGIESDDIEITIGSSTPVPDLGTDLSICPSEFPLTLDAGLANSYLWSTGETSQTISVNVADVYWVQFLGACGSQSDSVLINLIEQNNLSLGDDITICEEGFPIILSSNTSDVTWSTGETDMSIQIENPGSYWAQINGLCGTETDSIEIMVFDSPTLTESIVLCEGDTMEFLDLTLSEAGTYVTTDFAGSLNGCDQEIIAHVDVTEIEHESMSLYLSLEGYALGLDTVWTEEGVYEYIQEGSGVCPTMYTVAIINPFVDNALVHVPNAFTPNGDGLNDYFKPTIALTESAELRKFSFKIYDRDGHLVFEASDLLQARWNGQLPEESEYYAKDDLYSWTLDYALVGHSLVERLTGQVLILR